MSDAQARRRPSWGRLGDELRRLRKLAGLNLETVAAALKVSKATVTRHELGGAHGGSPPSVRAVMLWAAACEIASPDRPVLRALAEAALDEHRPYEDWGSLATIQQGVKADEATASTLRNFDPWGVPGLFQTGDYAAAILAMTDPRRGDAEVAEAVAVRMDRKSVLYRPGRRFEFLVTEEGLRRPPAGREVQRTQLDELARAVRLQAVVFRIIPTGAPMRASLGTGFVLYEDRDEDGLPFVGIELPTGRAEKNSPAEVKFFQARYEALSEGAIHGTEAVAFIRDIEESLS
jgi:transcriptional regulator with XRE-family HTH domain